MGKTSERRPLGRRHHPSSSFSRSSDRISTSSLRTIEEAISKIISKETEGIKQKLEEQKEEIINIHRQLKEHNENHIVLCTKLEQRLEEQKEELKEALKEEINKIHGQLKQLNGSSGDGSPAPRSEPNQMHPPRFSLKIKSKVKNPVEKEESIIIAVDLYDGGNLIAPSHPLASAKVMMVVLDGKFNDNRSNWSKEDFEKSIKTSTTGDVNQGIVRNCVFYLNGGTGHHSGATICENSGNSKVKLGVMVLPDVSYEEYKNERVLEGVSEGSFLVRDPPRTPKKQRQLQLQADTNMPSSSSTPRESTLGEDPHQAMHSLANQPMQGPYGIVLVPGEPSLPAYTGNYTDEVHPQHLAEQARQPSSFSDMPSPGVQMAQFLEDLVNEPIPNPIDYSERFFPVQLLWDRPGVEPSKRWNLLDQLIPLYSSQTKIHSGDFPTMRLMPEHYYDSLTTYSQGPYQRLFFNEQALFLKKMTRDLQFITIPKEVMQTHRNRGVLIQPLEPDDSDDKPPLKRKLRNKYQLRFVNKVCEAYYTGDKIKADDGNLLNVALYDENNAKITSGPLSSASVEVVVLHGDFNATGQDYWTSEEFSSCVVCPQSRKEPPTVGGDRVLVLVDGQASLGDAFFQKSSIYARTGKFKMGVMLASTSDERVREGISEPFWVWNRKGGCTGCTSFQRWHTPINALIFISRLRSGTYRTRKMRRPLLSRDTGDACLELLKEEQCMQDSLLDAWMSEGFGVQLPKAAVTKNVTLLDPQNNGMAPILGKQPMYGGDGGGGGDEVNGCGGGGANDDELSDDGSQAGEKKRRLNVEQVRTLEKNVEQVLDYDALRRQYDAIKRQNDALDAELDALKRQRDAFKAETDALLSHNKKLQAAMTEPDEERSEIVDNEEQDKQDKEKQEKEEAKKTKAIAQRSIVWESFTKMKIGDTVTKAKCKHCGHEFCADPRYGTSILSHHLKGCERNPNRNTNLNQGTSCTPYLKMLKKGDILDVKDEEYTPFADIKENDNEDAAEEARDGNSGKEKGLENTHGASSISMQTLQSVPNIRSGSFAYTGDRSCMEDEHIRIDDLCARLGSQLVCPLPSALYGVFDGHGGPDAAAYMKKHATKFLFEDCDFPKAAQVDEAFLQSVAKSVRRAFSQADLAIRNAISHSSGTTALIALVFGRQLLVGNAGDSRAVLCRKGVAIKMSRDQALVFPLISEPEFQQAALTGDDEFLILACGGLWDVMTSTYAVHVARRELCKHGDPERCASELVSQALRLGATKNLTVIVVCFFKEFGSLQTRQPKRKITSPINPHGSKFPRIEKE